MPHMERAAGFWRRFGAALVDGLLLGLLIRAIDAVTGWHTAPNTIWLSGGDGAYLLLSAAYFTYLHGLHGQTAGDAAMGLRVVDFDTGEVIGLQRAFIRW